MLFVSSATLFAFTQPPITNVSPFWPDTGKVTPNATTLRDGTLVICSAFPLSASGIPCPSVTTVFSASLVMPEPTCQPFGNSRLPFASVCAKSAFISRFTRFAIDPVSSCGHANHTVPALALHASSSVTLPACATSPVTYTRSQPSAAGPPVRFSVDAVTFRLSCFLFPLISRAYAPPPLSPSVLMYTENVCRPAFSACAVMRCTVSPAPAFTIFRLGMLRHLTEVSRATVSVPLFAAVQSAEKSRLGTRLMTTFCSREVWLAVFGIPLSNFADCAYPSSSYMHTTFPASLN